MATNIRALPELTIPSTIRTNEDWIDSVAFFDVNGNPVALDGIDFDLQCRASAASGDVLLDASTDNGLLVLCSAGALIQPQTLGAGYLVGDLIYPAGGSFTIPATLVVTALGLSGLTLVNQGTLYAVGDTLPLAGGIASAPAVLKVTAVGSNGQITSFAILTAGSYTVVPTTYTQASTSGSGVGATFGFATWGIVAARMTQAGSYSVVPANPVSQGSTGGIGAGATFNFTWVNNALCIAVPDSSITDYLLLSANLYEIRAEADGYTQVVIDGALTVLQGTVR